MKDDKVLDFIYRETPDAALLSQLAEECLELAHVCLKYERKIRSESPTPVTYDALERAINTEAADVLVCLDVLIKSEIVDPIRVERIRQEKLERWRMRLEKA